MCYSPRPCKCAHDCPRHGLVHSSLISSFRGGIISKETWCMHEKQKQFRMEYIIKTRVKAQLTSTLEIFLMTLGHMNSHSSECPQQLLWSFPQINTSDTWHTKQEQIINRFDKAESLKSGCLIGSNWIITVCRLISVFPKDVMWFVYGMLPRVAKQHLYGNAGLNKPNEM